MNEELINELRELRKATIRAYVVGFFTALLILVIFLVIADSRIPHQIEVGVTNGLNHYTILSE